jgi:anaerobic selenocysteine-containing dehydrogenase
VKLSLSDVSLNLRQMDGPLTRELVLEPAKFGLGLGRVPANLAPDKIVRTICGFCSTGCALNVHLREGQPVNLTADPEYPVNLGMACPKGWESLTPLAAPDRGTTPLLRDGSGNLRPIDWHHALREFCTRLKTIQREHGPESIAFLSTGQICTEEMALLGCLYKFGMGGIHCDSNTRQCMATTHVAYKQSFGFDAPPFTYADFEESDVLVFIGANPCIAHPIMWQRVMRNPHHPEIIVIDPRHTETAASATQHYPLLPKSDLTLLYGLAHLLITRAAINRPFIDAHTTGFDDFAQFVQAFTLDRVSTATGLPAVALEKLADTIARGRRVSFWWTMGVNQSHEATRTAQAIINLALMTGNIGRPGTGANSITGQCNAMGSRLYSNITSLIGGHEFANPDHRAKVARILHIPEAVIPTTANFAYDQIIDAINTGQIRALWIIATNTAHSWIHQSATAAALAKLDFLVVQDLYPTTETARLAHLYLPAAGWGEKEGTMINSERRIGLTKKVHRAPGQALADFHIFKLIAEYWGCGEMFARWTGPEATFQILKQLSRETPCDITAIRDYQMLDTAGGIQWPWAAATEPRPTGSVCAQPDAGRSLTVAALPPPERRLFTDGQFYTPDRRARFIYSAPEPPPELASAEFPLTLLTGRGSSAQWHTGTRTNKSDVLRALAPADCYIEINPADARALSITANSRVRITSPRASITARAFITPTIPPAQVFIPMHYPDVNALTRPTFDAQSRQPSYKYCAVRVERIAHP